MSSFEPSPSDVTAPAGAAAPPKKVTPAIVDDSLRRRMTVDKNVVDELLLVCGVIGTTVESDKDGQERLVPVTDCLNWLQDLQRALRRDDDLYRPISILLGQWKVVQQKLLPLVLSCRYDTPMILTICKILVILTKPLSENAQRNGRMVIETNKKKTSESVIKEQIKLRENALQQAETLMEYKRAICHHPSHLGPKQEGGGGVLSVFVSLLAEPLSRTGTARTDEDHLTIELVLHLFRNLLSAEPLLHASAESAHRAQQLHDELITLLQRELVLEILLVLGADLEQRENAQYNLLVMELLHHLFRNQDPAAVARSSRQAVKENQNKPQQQQQQQQQVATTAASRSTGRLKQLLSREKQSLSVQALSRHSHFGGTLVVQQHGGRKKFVSAVRVGEKRSVRGAPVATTQRKNKKSDPFIGGSRSRLAEAAAGPAHFRALRTLDNFCQLFVKDCYGPVMKNLKNEFRRDSVRLEDGDRVIFFRVVWFFCQWWRVSGKKKLTPTEGQEQDAASQSSLGQLIFTMDYYTFSLVLNATDTFQQHKKYARLEKAVALLNEMMQLLHVMYISKESTERVMGIGLMYKLFYFSEPLDRLPKLLSNWEPGTSTREYLSDLVEVCHLTLKLLEASTKEASGDAANQNDAKHDKVAKMKAAAADFDIQRYLARKLISNQVVFMYTHLLSQYATNAPHVNHHIVAFFLRLTNIIVAVAEESSTDPEMPRNLLATKTVTLEPMLYNIQLLTVLDTILNDVSIRNDKNYASLLSFAAGLVHNFARAAQTNPMLFVEALFKHPVPHRYCDLSTNMYVNEELRMIGERELLLEEQQRFDEETAAAREAGNSDDEDEEEELEFEDFGISMGSSSRNSNKKEKNGGHGKRKVAIKDSGGKDGDSAKDQDNTTTSQEGQNDSDESDEEDNLLASIQKRATERKAELKKIKRGLEQDSDTSSDDDDEIDFGNTTKAEGSPAKKARVILDDEQGDD